MKYGVVVCICVVSLVALAVAPAGAASIQKETVELNTRALFNHSSYSFDGNDLGSLTDLNVFANVGYFATSLVEIVGGLTVLHRSADPEIGDSYSATDFGMAASVRFNFSNSSASMVPFVGVGAGIVGHSGDIGQNDNPTIAVPSLEAGLRFVVGSSASVNVGVAYEYQIDAGGADEVSANMIMFGVGISAFVNGGPE